MNTIRIVAERARRALGLRDAVVSPERSKARHSAFQIAMGINIGLVAVGLPVAWNRMVAEKQNNAKLAREQQGDPFLNATEALMIQMLVNERRSARGVAPYPYRSVAVSDDSAALFEAVERVHKRRQLEEAAVQSDRIYSSTGSLPVFASAETRAAYAEFQAATGEPDACTDCPQNRISPGNVNMR